MSDLNPTSPAPHAAPSTLAAGQARADADRASYVMERLLDALENRLPRQRTGHWIWRAAGNALKTEWKYLLVGLMILVGHYKYHLSLLYYVHELAHTQQEHIELEKQRRSNAQIVKHHIDLGNALFGEGEMREAENEYRQGLKLDPSNLDAQRGLFKASIFNEVDDDTNQRNASPVVILSRIRELACEVQEQQCVEAGRQIEDEQERASYLGGCDTNQWQCIRQREGAIPAAGMDGAHVKLLEGMALTSVDPEGSMRALALAITLADGHPPDNQSDVHPPTKLAAAYIRIGDNHLGEDDVASLRKAIANYQIALRVAPWNINALDSLGYALHRSGRLEEARDRFEYLTRLDDTLMVAHADLGRTLRSLGMRRAAANGPEMIDAYDQQHQLLSLLTKQPAPVTRDSTSQWIFPVKGRLFDLHEPALKIAYATCALCTTGHLQGLRGQIPVCRRALQAATLTTYQRETARDFLLVELDELMDAHPPSAQNLKRVAEFRGAVAQIR